ELRTPLTSIRGYTEILADDDGLNDPQRTIIGIIDRNGQRLLDLIEDLLTFSSVEAGTLTLSRGPVRLHQVVDSACAAVRPALEAAGLSLTVDVAAELPTVDGDAAQLERVLLNLLSNAVKFSDRGGSVTVTGRLDGADVVMAVRDT